MKKDDLLRKVDRNGLIIISFGVALVYWRFDSLHSGEIMTACSPRPSSSCTAPLRSI